MFTGIITSLAKIIDYYRDSNFVNSKVLVIAFDFEPELGESIALNGICLTVAKVDIGNHDQKYFCHFNISQETLTVTNAQIWQKNMFLNVERSIRVGDRLSGHFVYGHVDGIGVVKDISCDFLSVKLPSRKYLVYKGSISLNGISLTINKIIDNIIEVTIIPHTYQYTNVKFLKKGDLINIEYDMIAKYSAPSSYDEESIKY